MGLDDLFGDYVPPQQEKQLVPKPPTYEEPPSEYEEPPPEYDDYEEINYGITDEDLTRERLNDLDLSNYENIQELYESPDITTKNKLIQLNMLTKKAIKERQKLNGSKANITKKYNAGEINESTRQERNKKIDNDRSILTEYINFNKQLINELKIKDKSIEYKGLGITGRGIVKKAIKERNRTKGYKAYVTKKYKGGAISEAKRDILNKQLDSKMVELNELIKDHEKKIKGRGRRQRGGNVMFFNDVKQLLKKLELIIGEVLAGNTSIQMRNTGVNILDTLLRMATINRPQYNQLYNKYFKV